MSIEEGTVVQGDGSSGRDTTSLAPPRLYVVRGGQLHVIPDAREFRKGRYDREAVKVTPDAELKKMPLAAEPRLAPGGEIVLDLDSFLGARHYMTTWGLLRKTAEGGHVDATTRTRTITMFGGFHGAVNMVYSDARGFPVGMSATQRYGVDGTWIGRSDRTDYWSDELSDDWATRTTQITLFHFWAPDRLDDVVRRGLEMHLTGWRRDEVLWLGWTQVDRLAGVIRLADSKTGEGRVVPINPALGAIIARRWEARSTRRWDGRVLVSPWVFHGPLGGRLHEDQVYAAWYAACDRAGLPPPRVA